VKNLYILLLFIFFLSCADDFVPDNPVDPENPDYIPPIVSIVSGLTENEVLTVERFTINFSGNELSMLFRTKIDSSNWTGWFSSTSQTVDFIDEGSHNFYVQGRYTTGDTSNIVWIPFEVDAVQGPALMFLPRRHIVSIGEKINFKIKAEEVYNLAGAEFHLSYDPALLSVESVISGDVFSASGSPIFLYEDKPESGLLTITSATWGQGISSYTGTAVIADIEFEVQSVGEIDIFFDGTEVFRDLENETIIINETIHGRIESN
jgi:hypothetical protein